MITQKGKQRKNLHKPKNRAKGYVYGGWIKYQLSLINVSQADIAEVFGVRDTAVWAVIHGKRTSARIQKKIAEVLGLSSWESLLMVAENAIEKNIV